jgi:transposase
MKPQRFTAEAKANLILEVLRGDSSVSDVCREHGIAQSLFYKWRDKFMSGAIRGLSLANKNEQNGKASEIRQLKQLIGELTVENQILKKTQELMGPHMK